MKKFSISYIATLANGLPLDSRFKRKLADLPVYMSIDSILLAFINDHLTLFEHSLSDSKKGERPKLLSDGIFPRETNELVFSGGEEFERAREEMLKKIREEES